MRKRYPTLCATVSLALTVLVGCTPPKKIVHADYADRAKKIQTIGLLAPDIDYFELSLGGVREKKDEETELVRTNITEALNAALASRGFKVRLIPREGEQKQDLDEILGLFTSIASSYHAHAAPQNRMNLFPHKAASFDYSVGPLDSVLALNHADALFLAKGFCEGNSLLTPGRTVIIMALADRTGVLLWYDRYFLQGAQAERNIRHSENAEKVISKTFTRLPEVPK